MRRYEPDQRLTATQALAHPFFGLRVEPTPGVRHSTHSLTPSLAAVATAAAMAAAAAASGSAAVVPDAQQLQPSCSLPPVLMSSEEGVQQPLALVAPMGSVAAPLSAATLSCLSSSSTVLPAVAAFS